MAGCWLNACLQLIFTALDQSLGEFNLNSELGIELLELQNKENNQSIDPTNIKLILVFAENRRIAIRKSELMGQITDKHVLKKRLEDVEKMRLNLNRGQQCVQDFFLCLHENVLN